MIPRGLIAADDFPRAMAGPTVMAQASQGGGNAAAIHEIADALEAFKAKHEGRYDSIEAELNRLAQVEVAAKLYGGSGNNVRAEDPEYSGHFVKFMRNGVGEGEIEAAQRVGKRAEIHASMTGGSNENGGYLAPTEWDRRIQQVQLSKSPMRRLAQIRSTTVGAYSTVWNGNQWGSGWVGETASRPATTTPTLSTITFGHGEIYANPAITQRLLDDAAFDVDSWIADSLGTEFDKQEGIAFISGDGVNKPFGLLQYVPGGAAATQHPGGALGITPSGHATQITVDQLIQLTYDLAAPYRQNATWLMSSQTAAVLSKLKDGQGNLIWREGLLVGQPATLLGRPVEIDENMPSIAADRLPIAFGDFRSGYLINDRMGVRVLRDPYTNKPYVMVYATKRVGAGVLDPNAIRLMKIAAS